MNIFLAGVCSTLLSTYPVYLTGMITTIPWIIALLSFAIDGIIDFALFGLLHLWANNHHERRVFLNDLFRLQGQRMVLAVLFFGIATGGHLFLMMEGLTRTTAFVLAYVGALVITRVVHTVYGIKTGLFECPSKRYSS